jgi:hypothetical protein
MRSLEPARGKLLLWSLAEGQLLLASDLAQGVAVQHELATGCLVRPGCRVDVVAKESARVIASDLLVTAVDMGANPGIPATVMVPLSEVDQVLAAAKTYELRVIIRAVGDPGRTHPAQYRDQIDFGAETWRRK